MAIALPIPELAPVITDLNSLVMDGSSGRRPEIPHFRRA
jgi:hypothetical protein